MNKKSGLILRIMLGAYLTYLGVDLVRTVMIEKPSDMVAKAAMGVAFVIVGICYAIWAVRGACKLYKTGNTDVEENEENLEEICNESEAADSASEEEKDYEES